MKRSIYIAYLSSYHYLYSYTNLLVYLAYRSIYLSIWIYMANKICPQTLSLYDLPAKLAVE